MRGTHRYTETWREQNRKCGTQFNCKTAEIIKISNVQFDCWAAYAYLGADTSVISLPMVRITRWPNVDRPMTWLKAPNTINRIISVAFENSDSARPVW
jgi:hypothetical protein